MPIETTAKVINHQLLFDVPVVLSHNLTSLEGKEVVVKITALRKRSGRQNRYYWGVVVAMVLIGLVDAGYEPEKLNDEVVHDFLKGKFNQQTVVNPFGEYLEIPCSTTELSKLDFMDYLGRIQQWAAEFLNIIIPDPTTKELEYAFGSDTQTLKT